VRSTFIDYFAKNHAHTHYRSSPVVPFNDDTIIFANAGMNQFKSVFTGTVDPSSPLAALSRAVNSQKCIRAGGKHNDLADVGKDSYHHTFFEMLGTWSFGNYFKAEAIAWAYDILVNVYKLPKDRLYASYFGGDSSLGLPSDEEAKQIWLNYLPPERVLPFNAKANFWEMGDSGPCGPCSEIHFDRIGGRDASQLVNADDPDVLEIWNLVFIQFNRDLSGKLTPLPAKHIDTGMGLERLTSVLQNRRSNYDTDIFFPLFDKIHQIVGGKSYSGLLGEADRLNMHRDTAYRVLADHARTLTFAVCDGAMPSNEGRGYVVRRILRRAARYAHQNLGAESGLVSKLVPTVVDSFKHLYPELVEQQQSIEQTIREEEESFSNLLARGVKYFNEIATAIESNASDRKISGRDVFFLYDTLGFPPDLTELMAQERGFSVDMEGFHAAMLVQKERSKEAELRRRASAIGSSAASSIVLTGDHVAELQRNSVSATIDIAKYDSDSMQEKAIVQRFVDSSGNLLKSLSLGNSVEPIVFGVLLSKTSFYAEAGGQVADHGDVEIVGGNSHVVVARVVDARSYGGYVLHTCVYIPSNTSAASGPISLNAGEHAVTRVNAERRRKIVPNHTFTHLLNFALRNVLGEDIQQKGSHVSEDRLRFDFNLGRSMKTDELAAVEASVNKIIASKLKVYSAIVPLKSALEINGIRAVFGETYPDPVRLVSVGAPIDEALLSPKDPKWREYSIELCGGTHLGETAEAEAFVIVEEGAVAKGIRRISALTGHSAARARELGESILTRARATAKEVDRLCPEKETSITAKASANTESGCVELVHSLVRLNRAVADVRKCVDGDAVAVSVKTEVRQQTEKMYARINKRLDAVTIAQYIPEIERVVAEAATLASSGQNKRAAVFHMATKSVLSDGARTRVLKDASDKISKSHPTLSFVIVLACANEDGQNMRTYCTATVPSSAQSGLNSVDWVSAALGPLGGKGGGRPAFAQGSVPSSIDGTDSESIGIVLSGARRYAESV
jgi:alanyl-tRNA synthetase